MADENFYTVKRVATSAFRITRSGRRFANAKDVVESFAEIYKALEGRDPTTIRLLIDLRPARGRNDAEFERTLAPERRKMMDQYPHCALLVRTTVGKLQLERYFRQDGSEHQVFADEDEAKKWLTG